MWTAVSLSRGPAVVVGGVRVTAGGSLQIRDSHRRCPESQLSNTMAVRFERPSAPLHGVARALPASSPRVRPKTSGFSEAPCKPSLSRSGSTKVSLRRIETADLLISRRTEPRSHRTHVSGDSPLAFGSVTLFKENSVVF